MYRDSSASRTAADSGYETGRRQQPDEPVPLHLHALEQLTFIRSTLEHSSTFTAVSGRGIIAMGLIALAAGALAMLPGNERYWLWLWLGAGVSGFALGGRFLLRKAQSQGVRLSSGVGRRFLFGLLPSLLAGAALTLTLVHNGLQHIIPGVWLLLYGVGVITAGTFSVAAVPAMGACFMLLGALALALPEGYANSLLMLGFGLVHMVFGLVIVKYHGG